MRVTIERLRTWIVVLAAILVVVILGFFGYARWQIRHFGRDLPGRLGIRVQQSTEGFTLSKSQGGHTIFTLHASNAVRYKDGGHTELHDVSITLYDPNGAPADRIYGNDFDYDSTDGVARANGAVQIDLEAPTRSPTSALPASPKDDEESTKNTVHVRTSDLVFNQRTEVASTTKGIEFRLSNAAGSATGASFDSQRGLLILDSDVAFNSSLGGTPLTLRARHAQFDRAINVLYLLENATDYGDTHSSSDQATIHFRGDGSAYRVTALGHVILTGNEGQRITSNRANIDLNQQSQPQQVTLDGGLLYVASRAARQMHATAYAGTLSLGPRQSIRHARLRTAVSVVDQEATPTASHSQSITRQLLASQVDIDFAPETNRRPIAQEILAVGPASMEIHSIYRNSPPQEISVQGDQLFATLRDGIALSSLRGTGHTRLGLLNPNGVKQTSTGDSLLLTFAPGAAPGAESRAAKKLTASGPQPANQLQSALQQGNVTVVEVSPAAKGNADRQKTGTTTATAQRATYDAVSQKMILSGQSRIRDESSELEADTIEFERMDGSASATGHVKATYRPSNGQQTIAFGGPEPLHVIADHADLDRAHDLTIFYGNEQGEARLWQGGDSISAPVLELSRSRETLSAHGMRGGQTGFVNAVFAGSGDSSRVDRDAKSGLGSMVRLQSRTLVYSDVEHKAIFGGGVTARGALGALRSDSMSVYFAAGGRPGAAAHPETGQKFSTERAQQIERMIAQGNVVLEQPSRQGTGDQLVYTSQDSRFVLTGTDHDPPRLVDQARGTITGATLIFNDRDDSVEVNGGRSKAITETHVAK